MKSVLFLCLVISVLHSVIHCDHDKDHDVKGNQHHDHNGKEHHDHAHDLAIKVNIPGHEIGKEHHDHAHDLAIKVNIPGHEIGKEHHDHAHDLPIKVNIPSHKIADGNAEFAFRIFKHICDTAGSANVFFSPASISGALALLSLGAKSTTHSQIIEGLGFNLTETPAEDLHTGFKHLQHTLNNPKSELQLNTGNALFIHEDLKILKKFLDDAKNFYEADIMSSNFNHQDETKKQINDYVEKKTHGNIVDLLESVDQSAVMVLVNYIFFKGKWQNVFNSNLTKEDDFFVDKNTTVKVPMMEREGTYLSWRDSDLPCTIVRLNYEGNASAFFVLPDQGKMKMVEKGLSVATLKRWSHSNQERFFSLHIPKFSISATVDLKEVLQKVGVTEVFSDMADLTGITGQNNLKASKFVKHRRTLRHQDAGGPRGGQRGVKLTAVHRADLKIDEQGTEAAGATAIEIKPQFLPLPISFNRPFVVTIVIESTILFMGKITDPTKA